MNSEASAPVRRGLFAAVCERLAGRSDSEHIQALVRIAIAGVGLLYVAFISAHGKLDAGQKHGLYLIFFVFLVSLGIFALIVARPQTSPPRRIMAMIFDYSMMSYFMYIMEDIGILFFPVYLWVTIGNGLRYGTRYLYTAMIMGITAFSFVFVFSPYWREQWGFSTGLLVGLVALPLYFSGLLKQLGRQHEELKKLYEQMARHATHDSLTNLPNRKHF
ncbi:MAG: GGDEF domain-containing protein, partial [Pseudomonadota bacterium]